MLELLYYNSSDLSTQHLCPLKRISVGVNEGILFCFFFFCLFFSLSCIWQHVLHPPMFSVLLSLQLSLLKLIRYFVNTKMTYLCVLDLTCRHVFLLLLLSCLQICGMLVWGSGLHYYSLSFSCPFKDKYHGWFVRSWFTSSAVKCMSVPGLLYSIS